MTDAETIQKLREELSVVTTQRDIYKSTLDKTEGFRQKLERRLNELSAIAHITRHPLRPTLEEVDEVRNKATFYSLLRNDPSLNDHGRAEMRQKYDEWMARSWYYVTRFNMSDAELDKKLADLNLSTIIFVEVP